MSCIWNFWLVYIKDHISRFLSCKPFRIVYIFFFLNFQQMTPLLLLLHFFNYRTHSYVWRSHSTFLFHLLLFYVCITSLSRYCPHVSFAGSFAWVKGQMADLRALGTVGYSCKVAKIPLLTSLCSMWRDGPLLATWFVLSHLFHCDTQTIKEQLITLAFFVWFCWHLASSSALHLFQTEEFWSALLT